MASSTPGNLVLAWLRFGPWITVASIHPVQRFRSGRFVLCVSSTVPTAAGLHLSERIATPRRLPPSLDGTLPGFPNPPAACRHMHDARGSIEDDNGKAVGCALVDPSHPSVAIDPFSAGTKACTAISLPR